MVTRQAWKDQHNWRIWRQLLRSSQAGGFELIFAPHLRACVIAPQARLPLPVHVLHAASDQRYQDVPGAPSLAVAFQSPARWLRRPA